MTRRISWCAGLAFALSAACADGGQPAGDGVTPRALRAVASAEVQRLAAEVGDLAPLPRPDDESRARVQGLLELLSSRDARLARVAFDDLAASGPADFAALAECLERTELDSSLRATAASALARVDTPSAAEILLDRIELVRSKADPEPWMRAQCAWRLAEGTQDWIVPRLVLHLRYETDDETVIWIAATLARFANHAGLDALYVIARNARTEEIRAAAVSQLARLAADAGQPDADALFRAWNDGTTADAVLSPRRELEIWRWIAGFAEWQLRGVDDGRFVLAREHRRAAPLLARALEDEDRYVRTHSAQALERMGARGRDAGPALLAALSDPEIAPQAMLSLGAVGFAEAEPQIVARLEAGHPLDERVAAARALGRLAKASSSAPLEACLAEPLPPDLRIAAACARLRCSPSDAPRAALDLALRHMTSGEFDPGEPEDALEAWLAGRAAAGNTSAAEALQRWRSVPTDVPAERTSARAEILRGQLEAILGA